jgi:signal peptidase I
LASLALSVALLGVWFAFFRAHLLGGSTNYILVSGHSMEPTLWTGDLVILKKQRTYSVGDIIAYQVENGGVVIHRITGGDAAEGYTTQGDNRETADMWRPKPQSIGGRQWIHVPKIGIAITMMRAPQNLPVVAALAGFLAVLTSGGGKKRRAPPQAWPAAAAAHSYRYQIPPSHPAYRAKPAGEVERPRRRPATRAAPETVHAAAYDLWPQRRWRL